MLAWNIKLKRLPFRGSRTHVVNIAILAIAAQINRVTGVLKTEEVQTTHASLGTRLDTDSDCILGLLVNNDVVTAAQRKGLNEMARKILFI